jgi:RNA polymerase sigma-70 factor, ECF subfamily
MLATGVRDNIVRDRADEFSALTERHLDGAYRLAAVILVDAMEAEDAVHDAAIAAWRGWSSLRDPDRFEAWFSRIVVNGCRDRLRSRRRRPVVQLTAEADTPSWRSGGPADEISRVASRDAMGRAMAVLEPDELIVVVLRYYRDLQVDAIAARLGIPAGTVKSRLHNATQRLRAALAATGDDR